MVEIPYEHTTLSGYFFRSHHAPQNPPLIIAIPGGDAWVEENKYIADGALARGYHCLLINGPGQGMAIREKNLPFRPDWENVIMPIVDYVLGELDLDTPRIALFGNGLGGLFVTRAVAYDDRIRAGISNPGLYDLHEAYLDYIKPTPWGDDLLSAMENDPNTYNKIIDRVEAQSPLVRWMFANARWTFGATSTHDLHLMTYDYAYGDDINRIQCPMLIMDGEDAGFGAGQAKRLYEKLSGIKEYMLFKEKDAASLQCQNSALSLSGQRMFDWLDEHL
jgi:alpha-beta hydrolase superfamily lysophospholipase